MIKNIRFLLIASATSVLALCGTMALSQLGSPKSNGLAWFQLEPNEYTLRISAEDLEKGYATTTSGAHISFESDGIASTDDQLRFAKNSYLRFLDPINGTSQFTVTGLDNGEALTLFSGYAVNSYGAAATLGAGHASLSTYFRTHFQLSNGGEDVTVYEIAITYSCQTHYDFTPAMATITADAAKDTSIEYNGLSYVNDVEPNEEEVDIVTSNFSLHVPDEREILVSTLHPTASYYDKGGCLIKQAEGTWVIHIQPTLRFYTSCTQYKEFVLNYGANFNLSNIQNGPLSSFDWSEYTVDNEGEENDGVLLKPITASLDLYPKVRITTNPGAGSTDESQTITFTPNPNATNFGFPTIDTPTLREGYHFSGWYDDDVLYDPATADDFHDYDLIGQYSSDFDLRLKFINRGFDTPYYEVGIPASSSYSLDGATSSFIDQTTTGLGLGYRIASGQSTSQGYRIFPRGNRADSIFYGTGDAFANNGLGTHDNPADYVAEPFTHYSYDSESPTLFTLSATSTRDGVLGANIESCLEYRNGSPRSYFKTLAIPDSVGDGEHTFTLFSTGSVAPSSESDFNPASIRGIVNTVELEKIVGNDHFHAIGGCGFSNNAELKKLEYFPALTEIGDYAFYHCPNLTPMNEWENIGDIASIGAHAFDQCYSSPLRDEGNNIVRREIVIPNTVTFLGELAFGKAVYTDFDWYPSASFSSDSLHRRPFAYGPSDGSVHSEGFAAVLQQYEAAEGDAKQALIPTLKAHANKVTFHGSQSAYETLLGGSYDELSHLLNEEYYVVFTD